MLERVEMMNQAEDAACDEDMTAENGNTEHDKVTIHSEPPVTPEAKVQRPKPWRGLRGAVTTIKDGRSPTARHTEESKTKVRRSRKVQHLRHEGRVLFFVFVFPRDCCVHSVGTRTGFASKH
jgi:hypothetical protein